MLRAPVRYLLGLLLGVFLLYYALQGFSVAEFWACLRVAKFRWVIAAAFIHLVNHVLRSFRWQLLINKCCRPRSLVRTFLAEMSGLCVNVPFPNFGEWMRCRVLKRLEGVPVGYSLSAVIVERGSDVLFCVSLLIGTMVFDGRGFFFLPSQVYALLVSPRFWFALLLFLSIVVGAVYVVVFRGEKRVESMQEVGGYHGWLLRVWRFFHTVAKQMVLTVRQSGWFIWGLTGVVVLSYFFVEYVSLWALDATSDLGLAEALYVFFMINLGAVIPIPGRMGSFHLLVAGTLVNLGVARQSAMTFAIIAHGIQVVNSMVVGGLSLLLSTTLPEGEERDAACEVPKEEA